MRFFNTEGPIRPDDHYAIPPLARGNTGEILRLIQDKRYFVLHAPRQTGKTSALIALRDLLNSGEVGNFRCVDVNVEVGQVARDNVAEGMRAILSSLAMSAELVGDDSVEDIWPDLLAKAGPHNALRRTLARWCMANPVPLVLLVDEIDSLVGDTLLSVLRQLRAGYAHRPRGFPHSIVLCGVRDIRDYRIRSSTGEMIAGGSPFNVAAKSLRLGDFSKAETYALIQQHQDETDQPFTSAARKAVWKQTQGQPWLVNALCAGACFDNEAGRDRSRTIAREDIFAAREELILSRRTHLDQLAHKLEEERVRRVVAPILSGGTAKHKLLCGFIAVRVTRTRPTAGCRVLATCEILRRARPRQTGASHGWRTCSRSQLYNLRASRTCWMRPTLWVEDTRQASGRPRHGADRRRCHSRHGRPGHEAGGQTATGVDPPTKAHHILPRIA